MTRRGEVWCRGARVTEKGERVKRTCDTSHHGQERRWLNLDSTRRTARLGPSRGYISMNLSKSISSRAHGSSVTGLSPLRAGGT